MNTSLRCITKPILATQDVSKGVIYDGLHLLTMSTKKRRHHHVWKRYLGSWTLAGQLTCLMDGRVFSTDPVNLAVEGDFYRLPKLDPSDVAFVRQFMFKPDTHPSAIRMHENFLRSLTEIPLFVDANRKRLHNLEKIDAELEQFRSNILEDYHANAEQEFLPALEMMLNGDLESCKDESTSPHLFYYLAMQYMRTKGIKSRTLAAWNVSAGIDLSRTWDIISVMAATNIGCSLYVERQERKLVLVENATGVEFITGDQPILNLDGNDGNPTDRIVFYYPLSPTLALLLTETDGILPFQSASLSATQVRYLNARISKTAHAQIFGRSEHLLKQAHDDGCGL